MDVDDLPPNASDVISILTSESVPLRIYLEIAKEYYNLGQVSQFETILKAASSVSFGNHYLHIINDLLLKFNLLYSKRSNTRSSLYSSRLYFGFFLHRAINCWQLQSERLCQ